MKLFRSAKDEAWGQLTEATVHGSDRLTDDSASMARQDVAIQFSKVWVRLAMLLSKALGSAQ